MRLPRFFFVATIGLGTLGLALARTPPGNTDIGAGAPYAELKRQLQRRPADARAWVLKARLDVQAGRHELGATAYGRALEFGRKVARDPGVWVEYAEARGLAQGGSLRGEPVRSLERALALDGNHVQALDLAGSAAWEVGDFTAAARHWRRLLELMPQCRPELAVKQARCEALQRALHAAERRARLSLPPAR